MRRWGMPLQVTGTLAIPDDELEVSFARSGGAGGQNVNKVSSKVFLWFHARDSRALPPGVKQRFLERYSSRITLEGDLLIISEGSRDQGKNLTAARARLVSMIAVVVPPPVPRKKTKPTKGSQRRRLADKARASEKKRTRTSRPSDD